MQFHEYQSEAKVYKHLLFKGVKGFEERFMNIFMEQGPDVLRQTLRLKNTSDWSFIFDYLVFEHDLLKICISHYLSFFVNLVQEKGPLALRAVLGIEHKKYDKVFQLVFKTIGIEKGAVINFVISHQNYFLDQIKAGKGKDLRKLLCLKGKEYDSIWQEIVLNLHQNFSKDQVKSKMSEQRFLYFDLLMNSLRNQRSLD